MKALLLGPYPPPQGGVQTNIVAIRRYLRERGIPCGVINLTRHRRPDADEVYFPESPLGVVKLLLTLPYDVIHLHVGGDLKLRLLGMGLFCSMIPGKKIVFTFHSGGYPSSPEAQTAGWWTFRGFVFRRFEAIIAVNAELLDLFRKFGVRDDRLHTICPHSMSSPMEAALPDRLQNFVDAHRPFLLTVAGLEPEYDIPLQIEALGKLRGRFPNAGLVIAGSGSQEQSIRQLIQLKPWAAHILQYGDMPHGVTLRAMSECDVMLRTTLYDGDAISVREALHLGVPVIATDNGMRPAGVILFPKSDLNGLCDAISSVIEGNSERAVVEDAGGDNLEAILNLYRSLAVPELS